MNQTNFFLILFFILAKIVIAQSSMVYEIGTTIEVTTGADICADNVSIRGTYTGTGTLCNGPLPVEISLFTATFLKNEINLYWKTETEVNNYGFNVERRINEGDWDSIAFIEGHGNSNSPKEYSYIDKEIFAGGSKFQYRLKQVDNDGTFEYSDIVEVELTPNKFTLFQNYPNPFNPSTTIRYQLPEESKVTIKIYDILGTEVATLLNEKKEPGIYEVQLNGFGFASGTYIYRIIAGKFVENKKMVLMK